METEGGDWRIGLDGVGDLAKTGWDTPSMCAGGPAMFPVGQLASARQDKKSASLAAHVCPTWLQ